MLSKLSQRQKDKYQTNTYMCYMVKQTKGKYQINWKLTLGYSRFQTGEYQGTE